MPVLRSLALAALTWFAAPAFVAAQVFLVAPGSRTTGRWTFDVGAQLAQPIGEFANQIDRAWGIGGTVRYHFSHIPVLGLRGDAAVLNYGNERKRVPLSATINRVFVDMNTANNIGVFSAGPELMVASGPIRPYAFATGGFSYFFTETSVGDDNSGGDFASSTNYHDAGWATGLGGGVRVPLAVRSVDMAIDAGARLTRNGTRTYLRRGDIVDQPDGSLLVTPRRTPADFWQYHVALSFSPRFR